MLTTPQLIAELSNVIDPSLAKAIVENYVEMQQRFLAGDWQPSELDGGRLCEALARAMYQLDSGMVTLTQELARSRGSLRTRSFRTNSGPRTARIS